ncbi:MAG: hypothetical protein GY814_18855 [Gammaproteobacteria bacterium]|nr:hypothetical protein [Gammaproteobacteria bacterium]
MANMIVHTAGRISLVLFLVFVANIFYGKAVISFGLSPLFKLSDVMEFLLLFLVAIFFVIFALQREKTRGES